MDRQQHRRRHERNGSYLVTACPKWRGWKRRYVARWNARFHLSSGPNTRLLVVQYCVQVLRLWDRANNMYRHSTIHVNCFGAEHPASRHAAISSLSGWLGDHCVFSTRRSHPCNSNNEWACCRHQSDAHSASRTHNFLKSDAAAHVEHISLPGSSLLTRSRHKSRRQGFNVRSRCLAGRSGRTGAQIAPPILPQA